MQVRMEETLQFLGIVFLICKTSTLKYRMGSMASTLVIGSQSQNYHLSEQDFSKKKNDFLTNQEVQR